MASLTAGTETPLYWQVADHLATAIEEGTWRPGDRVPSLRRTSRRESVSLTTCIQAYMLLESRGLIEARPQSGFFVRPRLVAAPEPAASAPPARAADVDLSRLARRLLESTRREGIVPLAAACPSAEFLPTTRLGRIVSSLARTRGAEANAYCFPPGCVDLRRELARRSSDWAEAPAPDDFVITSGATEALQLALRAVSSPGDIIAVESPVYFGTLLLLQGLGLRAVEISTDPQQGICLDHLARALSRHRVAACVASPTCQNPLGSIMPAPARAEFASMLRDGGVPLIEDDVYGDTCFEQGRPLPLKARDRDGSVLSCGSFSKVLAPGYRVGWLAPGRHRDRVNELKFAASLASPALPQMAIAAYLRSGAYDHYVRRLKVTFREQVGRMRDAVVRHFPEGTRATRPAGGFVLWVELPLQVDTVQLADDAFAAGIGVCPGPLFSAHGAYRNCLRLNCGIPWSDRVGAAVETLGRLATAQIDGHRQPPRRSR